MQCPVIKLRAPPWPLHKAIKWLCWINMDGCARVYFPWAQPFPRLQLTRAAVRLNCFHIAQALPAKGYHEVPPCSWRSVSRISGDARGPGPVPEWVARGCSVLACGLGFCAAVCLYVGSVQGACVVVPQAATQHKHTYTRAGTKQGWYTLNIDVPLIKHLWENLPVVWFILVYFSLFKSPVCLLQI